MTGPRWLRRFVPRPDAELRLVCLPHAGGSAVFYRDWARLLPPDLEVVAVQYPGRAERLAEPAVADIAGLCAGVVGEIAELGDRRLALFGHSMGAVVAFEVARALAREGGKEPVRLFVSGQHAPHIEHSDTVHLAGDAGLRAELRRLGWTPEEVLANDGVMALVLPSVLADYTAIETYRYQPGPPLACPITSLVADADPDVTQAEAGAWREHTTGEFDLVTLPGDHFYLVPERERVLSLIAEALSAS
jgi:pyochelin biosynthesis protein PchC